MTFTKAVKNTVRFSTYFFAVLVLIQCKSTKTLLEKGKYEQAYTAVVKKMAKGKQTREDKNILYAAFDAIYSESNQVMDKLSKSSSISDLELIYEEYSYLDELASKGKPYFGSDLRTRVDSIGLLKAETKTTIRDQYWTFAKEDLAKYEAKNDKSDAQQSYAYFKKVKKYGGNSAELDSLTEIALQGALVRIGFNAEAPFDIRYNWDIDTKFSRLEGQRGYLLYIYDPSGKMDCFLDVRFENLNIIESEQSTSYQVSERIQTGTTTTTDEEGNVIEVPSYEEVYGTVFNKTIVFDGRWSASVDASSITGDCNYYSNRITATDQRTCEYNEYTGDHRAKPTNVSFTNFPDCDFEDEMVDEMLDDIFRDFRSYYF